MLQRIKLAASKMVLAMLMLLYLAAHAAAQSPANLVVNGSFENRTSPPAPTSGFSGGIPDGWVDALDGNPYLVHESHITVPGNAAIDGEIIVGGGQDIALTQTITTTGTGPLVARWWGNNEALNPVPDSEFYSTAIQFNDIDGNLLAFSGFRDNFNPDQITWFEESYTTSVDFAPGTYEVQFFIGGRASADNLIVTQGAPSVQVPTLTGGSLGLLVLILGLAAAVIIRQRSAHEAA